MVRRPFAMARALSLPEQIADQVSRAIHSGELGPGDRIREQELAQGFHVSRGPVREALRILEKDGVVRISANRGAHVTVLSIAEVNEIFEVRQALNMFMARRLCRHPAPALVAEVGRHVERLESLAADRTAHEEYVLVSRDLAALLARGAGNRKLCDMLDSLGRQTWRYSLLGLATPERRSQSARNWRKTLGAIRRRDADAAARCLQRLMEDSRRSAVEQLMKQDGASARAVPAKRTQRTARPA